MATVNDVLVPDCSNCIRYTTCEEAAAGTFCPMWQSKEPKPEGPDPLEAWENGGPNLYE